METTKVIITGIGSTTGISVIKGFRKQNKFITKIVGTDINDKNMIAGSSFCDSFYTVPKAMDRNYISTLLDICEKEKVQVLIPIIDQELLIVAENKDEFNSRGVTVVISDPETIRICNNKYLTFKFLKDHGFPTANTLIANEIKDPDSLVYPIFVKPLDGISSINAFKVNTPEEFLIAKRKVQNLVVQEYLEGDEYTTDVMADFAGNIFAVVPRQRISTKAGISYKGKTCKDSRLMYLGKQIAESLKIIGPANIQCMVSRDIISYFEVNPRFSGSLPLTIAAGINTPLWILKLLNGETSPNGLLPFKDVIMTRYWEEIFYEY